MTIVSWLTPILDDIIEQLKPSLERHKGCDIIDVNPGIGIWSSKIHEVVKPRRHLLVESYYKEWYKPYLQPLLDAPDSTYKLVQWEKDDRPRRFPTRYLEEGLLPDQKGLSNDSPKTGGRNDSLLFLINFSGLGVAKLKRWCSERWMRDWCATAHAEEGFHRNGFVRLLGWLDDDEKYIYLPRSISNRTDATMRTDLICHTEEVAGASADETKYRRSSEIEYLSSAAALARMEGAGMNINVERLDQVPQEIQRAKQDNANFDIKAVIPALDTDRHERRPFHKELRSLEAEYASGKFKAPPSRKESRSLKADNAGDGSQSREEDPEGLAKWKRMLSLQLTDRSQRKWVGKIDDMVHELHAIDRQDAAIRANTTLTEDQRKEQLAAVDAQANAFQAKVDKLPLARHYALGNQGDNLLAWNASPQILTWDHRRMEPLLCFPTDFHPIRPTALLDFQLHDDPIRLAPTTLRYFEETRWFTSQLFSATVANMLDRMHPGSAEALLPKCPSLRDLSKGGRRDPGLVTCRSLSREMLAEIAHAWEDWPFAPSPTELLGTASYGGLERDEWKGLKKMLGKKERIRPRGEELAA